MNLKDLLNENLKGTSTGIEHICSSKLAFYGELETKIFAVCEHYEDDKDYLLKIQQSIAEVAAIDTHKSLMFDVIVNSCCIENLEMISLRKKSMS